MAKLRMTINKVIPKKFYRKLHYKNTLQNKNYTLYMKKNMLKENSKWKKRLN